MRIQRAAVVALGIMAFTASGCSSGTAAPHRASSALVVGDRTLDGQQQQTVLIPLDPVTGRLGASIVVPAAGVVAVAPGGRFALLVDPDHDLAYPVELENGQVGRPIHVGSRPSSVAFSHGGTMAYIADAGSAGCALPGPNCSTRSDLVTPVDLTTDEPGRPIHTCAGPLQVAMAPSGDMLWVACFFGGVDEISTSSGRVVAHFDVPGSPGNFAFADGGRTVIVGQIGVEDLQTVANYIVLIDPMTRRVGKPIKVGLPGGTSVAAVTPTGVAYIDTWGHTGPRGQVTTEIIPLDLRSGRLGTPLAVPGSGEPVAVVEPRAWDQCPVRHVPGLPRRLVGGSIGLVGQPPHVNGHPGHSAGHRERADRRHRPDRAVRDRWSTLRRPLDQNSQSGDGARKGRHTSARLPQPVFFRSVSLTYGKHKSLDDWNLRTHWPARASKRARHLEGAVPRFSDRRLVDGGGS